MLWVSLHEGVSKVSKGKKWNVNPSQTLKVQEVEFTYSSTNFRNYEKKKNWVITEQNLPNLFYFDVPKWTSVKLDHFPCLAHDWKSPPQRRIAANIFGKEVDLHWWKVCSTNNLFIIRRQLIYSFHSGHRTTLNCKGLKCQQKVVYKKEN